MYSGPWRTPTDPTSHDTPVSERYAAKTRIQNATFHSRGSVAF